MFNSLIPGSVIIRIPKKPIMTANHLKIPTFSFSRKIDKIVVNIGAAKDMLTTVANGSCLKAINIAISAISPEPHLKACNPGRWVL